MERDKKGVEEIADLHGGRGGFGRYGDSAIFRARCFQKIWFFVFFLFKLHSFLSCLSLLFSHPLGVGLKPNSIVTSLPSHLQLHYPLRPSIVPRNADLANNRLHRLHCRMTVNLFSFSLLIQHINHHFSFNPFLIRRTGRTHSRLACRH